MSPDHSAYRYGRATATRATTAIPEAQFQRGHVLTQIHHSVMFLERPVSPLSLHGFTVKTTLPH